MCHESGIVSARTRCKNIEGKESYALCPISDLFMSERSTADPQQRGRVWEGHGPDCSRPHCWMFSRVDPCGSFWDSELSQNPSNPCWFGKMMNWAPQSKKSHGSLHLWHGIISIISLGENRGCLISLFCFLSMKCSTNGNLSTDHHQLSPQEAANETENYCQEMGWDLLQTPEGAGS